MLENILTIKKGHLTIVLVLICIIHSINRCWVIGWGETNSPGVRSRTVMLKVDVPLVPNDICQRQLESATKKRNGPNYRFSLHPGEVCAGGEVKNKDACAGDGGAPLVCQAPSDRWYVVGLVSWGVGCGVKDVPGAYTRVAYYRDWIDKQ